ncbi:NADPH-dependent FMN reductase [Actinomadura harenae]|uniref:NADPH-dependent oxidoreductase n=1 Tax=Actinomadura harenae TaxID=2483351 RepID=A0A3M2LT95_9ACTN|nr:NAD(P)H-dependent oxidoreductase [Actinomadura harenae]RMI40701.1 NADPH-dependent oxidoreductase [Actinomadura harenae]
MSETPPTAPPPSSQAPPLRVATILGSTRRGRFGPTIADWFTGVARTRDDMETEVIDLAETTPEDGAAAGTLGRADAFVVVTPEYNHSFPGGLKDFIDAHRTQWLAKPVAFVSYGGMSGGLRAVEHLRQVFAELHATSVRNVVSMHNPWTAFDADCPHARAAAHQMLDQLGWWGHALRDARAARPYEVA